jgi:glycosyltransferase involved in cell wall biosynthesis
MIEGSSPRIAVLLSTYNGESFIAAQLESLLAQTHQNLVIIVRDDGSSDSTPQLLKDYAQCFPDKFHIIEEEPVNYGPSGSFSVLCEYLLANKSLLGFNHVIACFCDQDDVWVKEKLELQLERYLQIDGCDSKPVLVHSDLEVVDQNLDNVADSLITYQGLEIERNRFPHLVVSNLVTGCTALFNEALLDAALPVPKNAVMHDWWFAMTATAFGELVFIPSPLVRYRQHGRNTIGAKQRENSEATGRGLVRRFLSLEHNKHLVDVARQAKEFDRHFGGKLSLKNRLALFLARRMRTGSASFQRAYYRLLRRF